MPLPQELYNKRWNEMCKRLESYKETYGNCNVSQSYKEDKQLANWVHEQRKNHKNNMLSYDRVDKLKSVGFVFIVNQEEDNKVRWNDMFQRLVSYKEKHGDCNLSGRYKEDKKLGRWVDNQRQRYKTNKLSNDRMIKLKRIGFVLAPQQESYNKRWNEMYKRLELYKLKHGNCLVPVRYKDDEQLGRWVHAQRTSHRKNKLSKERINKLESIGFVFAQRNSVAGSSNDSNIFKSEDVKSSSPDKLLKDAIQIKKVPKSSTSVVRSGRRRRTNAPISHNSDAIVKEALSSITIDSRTRFKHVKEESSSRSNNKSCDDNRCNKKTNLSSDDDVHNNNNSKKKKNINVFKKDPTIIQEVDETHAYDPNLVIVI